MRLQVTDTETTGINEHDQVMEVAGVTLGETFLANPDDPYRVLEVGRWHELVRPTTPCSFEARATHHILDSEVEGRPTMPELLASRGLPEFDGSVFVAHNAEFDLRMLRQSGVALDNPVICTWRCAQHLWPDAPSYSNQVLRYWLDLDGKYGSLMLPGLAAHRAPADALVTSRITMEMLRLRTAEELVELTRAPILHKALRFGKHAGVPAAEVPRSYWQWMYGEGEERPGPNGQKLGFDRDLRHTAAFYLGLVGRDGQPRQNKLI